MAFHDHRTPDQIKEHYTVERELADRLRYAQKSDRLALYPAVYNELFRRVPHHPQLHRKVSVDESRKETEFQMRYFRRFLTPETVFLEVGAGDCAVSFEVAKAAKKAYAVDVSDEVARAGNTPENFELLITDGCSIPVEAGTVTLAYSNQLMEHLHPDDALEQLRNLYAALAPGGRYVCITPHRYSGPHDVSQHFDDCATGFHLKEYINRELMQLFREVGFRNVKCYYGVGGHYLYGGPTLAKLSEGAISVLPCRTRRRLGRLAPLRALLGIRLVAQK